MISSFLIYHINRQIPFCFLYMNYIGTQGVCCFSWMDRAPEKYISTYQTISYWKKICSGKEEGKQSTILGFLILRALWRGWWQMGYPCSGVSKVEWWRWGREKWRNTGNPCSGVSRIKCRRWGRRKWRDIRNPGSRVSGIESRRWGRGKWRKMGYPGSWIAETEWRWWWWRRRWRRKWRNIGYPGPWITETKWGWRRWCRWLRWTWRWRK